MKRRSTYEPPGESDPGRLVEFLWAVNFTFTAVLVALGTWWVAIALWGAS